jgi:hypothetical protein
MLHSEYIVHRVVYRWHAKTEYLYNAVYFSPPLYLKKPSRSKDHTLSLLRILLAATNIEGWMMDRSLGLDSILNLGSFGGRLRRPLCQVQLLPLQRSSQRLLQGFLSHQLAVSPLGGGARMLGSFFSHFISNRIIGLV